MGRLVQKTKHSYLGKTFASHVLSLQQLVAKSIARETVYLTVVFVGETHYTVDERRRAILFGDRPETARILTVVERAMGVPAQDPHLNTGLVVEPRSNLSSADPERDQNVVDQISEAYQWRRFKVLLILFGEEHEKKIQEKIIACPHLPAMIWHFYPSFHDYMIQQKQTFPQYDPRSAGYTLIGMVRIGHDQKMALMQLAEGRWPVGKTFQIAVLSPFEQTNEGISNFAAFARGPLLNQFILGLSFKSNVMEDAHISISWNSLREFRVLDIEGKVRPVPDDLKRPKQRRELIEAVWQSIC